MKFFIKWISVAISSLALVSCSSGELMVSSVGYQSIRTTFAQPKKIPDSAKIAVEYFINPQGELLAVVYNLSNDIITIDQTKSFLINTNGQSLSYYDPTIKTTTSGSFNAETTSTSLNLGVLSNVFGLNGPLGNLLNSTPVGNASTHGTFQSNTVTISDMPHVRIGPRGNMALSKQFKISGVGKGNINSGSNNFINCKSNNSPLRFSVCISYALEDAPLNKLVTNFYVNSSILESCVKGKVNDSFSRIYNYKTDALIEPSYIFVINTNLPTKPIENFYGDLINTHYIYDSYVHGSLVDYQ